MAKTLLLLRHADAEATRPGSRDHERRLSLIGEAQAAALAGWLDGRFLVEHALCSTAVRTRQTLAALDPPHATDYLDDLYNAGGDTIVEAIRALPERAATALLVGHAPGVPAVVHDLADRTTSEAAALAAIEHRFPAGTLAVLRVEGRWADLAAAALAAVHLPADQ